MKAKTVSLFNGIAWVSIVLIMLAAMFSPLLYYAASAATEGHTPVTMCHKPDSPAAHFITVDDDAVQAHRDHGDWVWDGLTVATCGDETIYPPVTTPAPPPVVPGDPSPPVYKLFLPLAENGCPEGWPWCSFPN